MNLLISKLMTSVIEIFSQGFIGDYYSLCMANLPAIPETVNTERHRGRLKHAK